MIQATSGAANDQGLATDAAQSTGSRKWLIGFLALHLGCQLLLLVPALASARVLVRTAAFGASLFSFAFIPSKFAPRLPGRNLVIWILALLGLELLHPATTAVAGCASVMLNVAILVPIFWVPRTGVDSSTFQRLIVILWVFYTASSILGVLQSYFPGRFEPQLSTVFASRDAATIMSLKIKLLSGERIFRPMGLTDTPGGAAYGGLYSILLGTGVMLMPKPPFSGARILAVGSMIAGMTCLYLCQVRSIMVMVGICVVTLVTLLFFSGRVTRLLGLLTAVGIVIPTGFVLAFSLAGHVVTDRLSSLVESDAGTVYYSHRGRFLEQTINDYLPQFPLGAGLGRWGMISNYFGARSVDLWAEIQWTGWVFDGGLPLVLLYFAAIVTVTLGCLRVARGTVGRGDPLLSLWGAVLVAYDVGAVALCFNSPLFAGTGGIEFWLLNAALLCAAQNVDRARLRSMVAV